MNKTKTGHTPKIEIGSEFVYINDWKFPKKYVLNAVNNHQRLIKALKPFAKWADNLPHGVANQIYAYHGKKRSTYFMKSDCIRAKEAIKSSEGL